MPLLNRRFTVLLLGPLLWALHGMGQNYTPVTATESFFEVAPSSFLIHDPDNTLNWEEVLDHPDAMAVEKKSLNLDFTASNNWLYFRLVNETKEKRQFQLELARPLTNEVELYVMDEKGKLIEQFETGDNYPFYQRATHSRKFVFPVSFEAGQQLQFVVRAASDGEVLILPMKLWDEVAFTDFIYRENLFLGFFYGLLFFVILIFSLFSILIRKRIYLFFVGNVASVFMLQMGLDGLSFQYLWPNSVWLGNHSILIFTSLGITNLLLYVRAYLDMDPDKYRGFLRVYSAFIGVALLCLLLSFTEGRLYQYTFPAVNLIAILSSFLFFTGIYLKRKHGESVNFLFTLAFIALLLGAVLFVMSNANIIYSTFLNENALKLGSAVETVFLSIAMAMRYRSTIQQKEEAQEAALDNLQQLNTLKEEQNIKLEQQVKERTLEIQKKSDELEEKNTAIIESINYAQRLQNAILPSTDFFRQHFKDSFVLFLPKDIVSGDFYWAEKIDGKLYFMVGDCTGHGVPGAMVSMLAHDALNRCIKEFQLRSPAAILDRLAILVEEAFSRNDEVGMADGMDVSLCCWDADQQTLSFAGANNALYLVRDQNLTIYAPDKQPIGKFAYRKPFQEVAIELQTDDMLYLFTDGYADQFGGPKGKKFKYRPFQELLSANSILTAEAQMEALAQAYATWKGDEEQVDDVCVMGIQF